MKNKKIVWILILILFVLAAGLIWYLYNNINNSEEAFFNKLSQYEKKIVLEPTKFENYFKMADLLYFKALELKGESSNSVNINSTDLSESVLKNDMDNNINKIVTFLMLAGYKLPHEKITAQSYNQLNKWIIKVSADYINRAKDLYLKGLAMQEKKSGIYLYRLGECYYKLGKDYYDEAEYIFRKALDNGVNTVGIFAFLGNIEFLNGNKEEALLYYNKALEMEKDNPFVNFNLAVLYEKTEKRDKALKTLDDVINNYETSEKITDEEYSLYIKAMYMKARLFYLDKKYNESLKIWETILDREPNLVPALYWTGKTYQAIGSETESKSYFEKVKKLKPGYIKKK